MAGDKHLSGNNTLGSLTMKAAIEPAPEYSAYESNIPTGIIAPRHTDTTCLTPDSSPTASLSDTSFEVATGIPDAHSTNTVTKTGDAICRSPTPSAPTNLVRGIMNKAPNAFVIIPAPKSVRVPLKKD